MRFLLLFVVALGAGRCMASTIMYASAGGTGSPPCASALAPCSFSTALGAAGGAAPPVHLRLEAGDYAGDVLRLAGLDIHVSGVEGTATSVRLLRTLEVTAGARVVLRWLTVMSRSAVERRSALELRQCVVSGLRARAFSVDGSSSLSIIDGSVVDNHVTVNNSHSESRWTGGVIRTFPVTDTTANTDILLEGSFFSGNGLYLSEALTGGPRVRGGVLAMLNSGGLRERALTVRGCVFADNFVRYDARGRSQNSNMAHNELDGGVIFVQNGTASPAGISISDSSFLRNVATDDASVIYDDGVSHTVVTRSYFDSNIVDTTPSFPVGVGGVISGASSYHSFSDCYFRNNTAFLGGVDYLSGPGEALYERCVFSENALPIHVDQQHSLVTLRDNYFCNNAQGDYGVSFEFWGPMRFIFVRMPNTTIAPGSQFNFRVRNNNCLDPILGYSSVSYGLLMGDAYTTYYDAVTTTPCDGPFQVVANDTCVPPAASVPRSSEFSPNCAFNDVCTTDNMYPYDAAPTAPEIINQARAVFLRSLWLTRRLVLGPNANVVVLGAGGLVLGPESELHMRLSAPGPVVPLTWPSDQRTGKFARITFEMDVCSVYSFTPVYSRTALSADVQCFTGLPPVVGGPVVIVGDVVVTSINASDATSIMVNGTVNVSNATLQFNASAPGTYTIIMSGGITGVFGMLSATLPNLGPCERAAIEGNQKPTSFSVVVSVVRDEACDAFPLVPVVVGIVAGVIVVSLVAIFIGIMLARRKKAKFNSRLQKMERMANK